MKKTFAIVVPLFLALAGCTTTEQAQTDDAAQRESVARKINVDALNCDEKLALMDETNKAIRIRFDQQDAQNGTSQGLAMVSFIFPPAAIVNLAVGLADYSAAELWYLNSRLTASHLRHC